MVFVQKWPFFQLFFVSNIGQENAFYDILERNNGSLGYKNQKFKKSKNGNFSKAIIPWFFPKLPFFQLFVIRQYRLGKCVLRFSAKKNDFLRHKNKKFKKSRN